MKMKNKYVEETVNEIREESPLGVPVHARTQTPVGIEDVVEAVKALGENRDFVIKTILATYASTFLERKDPVWLMIVGNPSSNKTTLVDLLKGTEDVYRLDTMTSNPFSSGQREKDKPQDLLPLLNDKCFVIKEYGTLFGRNDEMVKQLISDLVAIYDGEYSKHSPTRGTVRYESFFSHIGCVTPMSLSARQKYMNSVGARFLFLKLPTLSSQEKDENLEKIWNEGNKKTKEDITEIVCGFCIGLKDRIADNPNVTFPLEVKNALNNYSLLIARARGIVLTDQVSFQTEDGSRKTHYEVSDIQVEEPFRALKQLRKFAHALTLVNGKNEAGEDELSIVRKIVLSSMPVRRADALRVFERGEIFTAKTASDLLEKNYKTVKRNFDELVALEVLKGKKGENDKAKTYELRHEFKEIFRKSDEADFEYIKQALET
jgi:hypothetical protein